MLTQRTFKDLWARK